VQRTKFFFSSWPVGIGNTFAEEEKKKKNSKTDGADDVVPPAKGGAWNDASFMSTEIERKEGKKGVSTIWEQRKAVERTLRSQRENLPDRILITTELRTESRGAFHLSDNLRGGRKKKRFRLPTIQVSVGGEEPRSTCSHPKSG